MLSKEEIKQWILENCVDCNGNVNLSGLDFSNFDGNIYLNDMKVKNDLMMSCVTVGGDVYQCYYTVGESLWQSNHKVNGNINQEWQFVGGNLLQNNQKVKGEIIQ